MASSKTLLSVDKINALQEFRKDFLCQICGEIFQDPMMPSTGCDHKYCEDCIFSHFRTGNWCPVCKLPLVPRDLRQCHKLGEILNEFKTLNSMYAIIQLWTNKNSNKNGISKIETNEENNVEIFSSDKADSNEPSQNSCDNTKSSDDNCNSRVLQTSNEEGRSDKTGVSALDKPDLEDPALVASQSSITPSKYLFPVTTDHVRGSLNYEHDDENYKTNNNTSNHRISSFIIEETMDMQETLNNDNEEEDEDNKEKYLEQPKNLNIIDSNGNETTMKYNDSNDDDNNVPSSGSSSSESEDDDDNDYDDDENLIDLDQLKKQIEREENELKELQGKTKVIKDVEDNKKKDLTNYNTNKRIREEFDSHHKYDENDSKGAYKLRVVDENVVQNTKRIRITEDVCNDGNLAEIIEGISKGSDDKVNDVREHNVVAIKKDHIGESSSKRAIFKKKAVFVTSMLSQDQRGQVEEVLDKSWASKFNPTIQKDVSIHTTHIITRVAKVHSATGALQCRRTMKYFHGVAVQAWIISINWIVACLNQNKWVDEEQYEIVCGDKDPMPVFETVPNLKLKLPMGGARRSRLKRFPFCNFESMVDFRISRSKSLLNDFKICVWHDFEQVKLKREEVVKLCRLSGATIVEQSNLLKNLKTNNYGDDCEEDQWQKKVVLVCPQIGMPIRSAKAYENDYNIYVVNHTWLLDTVSQSNIKNPMNRNFSFTNLGREIDY